MTRSISAAALVALLASAIPDSAVGSTEEPRNPAVTIDDARLMQADADTANWITHGRTYFEERFSPLDQIDANNASDLALQWTYDTGTRRGLEATPIVVDGILYATGSWSVTFALDARTGEEIWRYDPKVPKAWGANACCDVVNRGVAVYDGKVFVGTLDGRLVALDAGTGKPVWETLTIDKSRPYTITGAPRVVKGNVIIGNGGAEFGVRGYVSAYDAKTGKMSWRTYTVPGDPSKPFESKALEEAAKTWTGEWWEQGGGGTVWDSMAYDPELDLLYVGTGNGSPWSQHARSPGGGDNLFLSGILALDPDDGDVRWFYQTTPGDTWDFTGTQHMILADLKIDGKLRKVIMQAPKNGFFFVVDRETGKVISAENYVEVTWATGVDLETGRPIEAEGARFLEGEKVVKPTPFGGHNWHPMSFNPVTGLVYIPAHEITGIYQQDPDFEYHKGSSLFNTGTEMDHFKLLDRSVSSGHLLAWDPVKQEEAWRVSYKTPWNGGTLTTKGNLVFQGTADGRFVAYKADDGSKLWEAPAGTGVIAAPSTYTVDGVQYVTVLAGWGGAFAIAGGDAAAAAGVQAAGRVLTFALPKEVAKATTKEAADDERFANGEHLYHDYCVRCHGAAAVGGGVLPDLRKSSPAVQKDFLKIVAAGLPNTGMPPFAAWISKDEIEAIQHYVLGRARAGGVGPSAD